MNEVVRSEKVRQALMRRAVLLANGLHLSRDGRLEVAAMALRIEDLRSFNDLSENQLRKLIFGFETSALVMFAVGQESK
jgi:hypothetical protein